jgi:hypothetical protein
MRAQVAKREPLLRAMAASRSRRRRHVVSFQTTPSVTGRNMNGLETTSDRELRDVRGTRRAAVRHTHDRSGVAREAASNELDDAVLGHLLFHPLW